eukprot:TRINITY_DN63366_c0_g1_i1.p1 TRINITY_DN63366_c0_g1~~TRINITY_DN63366_c0_g1_i1.p1  ORF type:complete len:168 (-),score=24.93 TRINITY_DN63366_c0_g1_i1:55-558(-)
MSVPCVLGFFSVAVLGAGSSASFIDCVVMKTQPVVASCGTERLPRCTVACKSEIERLPYVLDGSCCSEAPLAEQEACIMQAKRAGSEVVPAFRNACSDVETFTRATLPFSFTEVFSPSAAGGRASSAYATCVIVGAATAGTIIVMIAFAGTAAKFRRRQVTLVHEVD